MFNLDDNELSKKSKEAAASFKAPISPNWKKISSRLDIDLPINERKKQIFWWWFAPALILISGLGYYYVTTHYKTNSSSISISNDSIFILNKKKENYISSNNKGSSTSLLNAKSNESQKDSIELHKNAITERSKSSFVDLIKESSKNENVESSSIASISNGSPLSNTSTTTISKNNNYKVKFGQVISNKAFFEKSKLINSILVHEHTNIYPLNTTIGKKSKVENNDDSLVIASISTNEQLLLKDGTIKGKAISSIRISQKKNDSSQSKIVLNDNTPIAIIKIKHSNLFSIEASSSTDFTTINSTYWNKLSLGGGILGGYYINSKWSVHSGLLYTRKNYKAAGEDFSPPKTSRLSNYRLETVSGYCQMWETPINVRYHFSTKKRKDLFVSAGLSSYFIRKENYDYTYYNQWRRLVTYNAQYQNPNNYIISIANISAGIEYPISKYLNIHLEPYLKLPLAGFGYSNMRLISSGINMSLMFKTKK